MNTIQAGRRSFLCSLAALTTGEAFGGVKSFAIPVGGRLSLKRMWSTFCHLHRGEVYAGALHQEKAITSCKGHRYLAGMSIRFPEQGLTAQPVWIFWDSDALRPSDLLIHFYKETGVMLTINQFELRLLAYPASPDHGRKPLAAVLQTNGQHQRV